MRHALLLSILSTHLGVVGSCLTCDITCSIAAIWAIWGWLDASSYTILHSCKDLGWTNKKLMTVASREVFWSISSSSESSSESSGKKLVFYSIFPKKIFHFLVRSLVISCAHPDQRLKLQEILLENPRLFLKMYCSQKALTV